MNGTALELRDIHPPPPPGFWPPAPGWWLLALLLLLLLAAAGQRLYRHWRHWRRRRAVLRDLTALCARDGDSAELAAQLSMLLRRVALARFDRQSVAGLSGAEWLAFLDATGGGGRFSRGPGSVLISAPYQSWARLDRAGLCALVEDWIRRNF